MTNCIINNPEDCFGPCICGERIDGLHLAIKEALRDGRGPALDLLLAKCKDAECHECATIICPFHCEWHFHHDGCPACAVSADRPQ